MSKQSCILYFILSLLLSNGCRVLPEVIVSGTLPAMASDSSSLHLAQRVDGFVQMLVPHSFNGALMVEKEGKLLLAQGYGRIQAQEGQAFQTVSITNTAFFAQQVTAVAILSLQEDGVLQLSDTLGQFFNDLPMDKKGISLQQLLTHTAGFNDDEVPEDTLLKQEFLDKSWQSPLLFAPGSHYHFSGAGYRILAAVVEERSGKRYEVYVRKKLFEPAGMAHTGYVLPDIQETPLAHSRELLPDDLPLQDYRSLHPALWQQLGSSGMLSTAEDLYRWQQMLFHGQLLKPASLNSIWKKRSGVPEGGSAYGWVLQENPDGSPLLLHKSQANGFACQLLYDQQKDGLIVLLANQLNRQVEALGQQVAAMLYQPYYMPALLPYSEQSFARIPQGPGTEHLRELLKLLTADQPKISEGFIEAHYSAELKKIATQKMHLQNLHQLQRQLSGSQLLEVEKEWPYYTLTYSVPEHKRSYLLKIGVEQEGPHYLSSLELDITDNLQ